MTALANPPAELWTTAQVADHLGMTVAAVAALRHRGNGPHYVRIGTRTIRYRRTDVDAWIDANREQQTPGAA